MAETDNKDLPQRKFAIDLWDCFERVFDRITKGRHDLKKIKQFLEERAQIEETYGKALEKFAKVSDLDEETSLSKTFIDSKDGAIRCSKQHIQFGVSCAEIAAALDKIINEIKNTKTKLNLTFQKFNREEKNRSAAHIKAKKEYIDAMKAAESATLALRDGKKRGEPKALEKLEKAEKTSVKNLENATSAYKKSVEALRGIQETLRKETAIMLGTFEDLELRRLTIMHEQLDRFAQSHDFLKSSMDQIALFLHSAVNAVNVKKDIQDFITKTATGKEPQPYVEYAPISSQILGIEHQAAANSMPSSSPAFHANISQSGAQLVQDNKNAEPSEPQAQALYDFDSTEPDELPFKVGDIIKVLSSPADNDWWHGDLNGRVGIFPKDYVQLLSTPAVAEPPTQPIQRGATGPVATTVNTVATSTSAPTSASTSPAVVAGTGTGASSTAGTDALKPINAKCVALYDFEAQGADELSFSTGDQLFITGELNGWYLGKSKDGRVGIFPSNYVNIVK